MSKKTEAARIIATMDHAQLVAMANDFIEMDSNAMDDGSVWKMHSATGPRGLAAMFKAWAKGLGSME